MTDIEKLKTTLHYGEGRAKPPSDIERELAVEQLLLALDDYFLPDWQPEGRERKQFAKFNEKEQARIKKLGKEARDKAIAHNESEFRRHKAMRDAELRRDAEAFMFDSSTDVSRIHSIAWYCLKLNLNQKLFQKAMNDKTQVARLETFLRAPYRPAQDNPKLDRAAKIFTIIYEMMGAVKNVQPNQDPGLRPEQLEPGVVPDGAAGK